VVALTARGRARVRAAVEAWRRLQAELSSALGEDSGRFVEVARRVASLAAAAGAAAAPGAPVVTA
jgi:hypothetical protein